MNHKIHRTTMTEEEFNLEIRKFRPISLLTELKPQLKVIGQLKPIPRNMGKMVEFVRGEG